MASFEGVTGDFATIFEWAQPTFKNNYMYMSGHTDAAPFDRELAERMPLANQVAGIHCPVLVGIGEFDELTPLADAIADFERIRAPKELRVYENEFHPLGGVAAEIFRYGAEWLERVLAGQLSQAGRDVRHYVQRDGTISNGSADPRWWMGRVPPTIAELRKSEV